MAWRLFQNPVSMGQGPLWLILPLCAMVAVVYKTIRIRQLRDLPGAVLRLWVYILVGLAALAAVLFVITQFIAPATAAAG